MIGADFQISMIRDLGLLVVAGEVFTLFLAVVVRVFLVSLVGVVTGVVVLTLGSTLAPILALALVLVTTWVVTAMMTEILTRALGLTLRSVNSNHQRLRKNPDGTKPVS